MAMRMDYDVMEQRANEFQRHADAVDEVVKKMDNLLKALESEWEGLGAQSFVNRYYELKPGFSQVPGVISSIANKLKDAARATREHDQSMKF